MNSPSDNHKYKRALEIFPGVASWLFIISPFILGFIYPIALSILILGFSIIWLGKAVNISRHLITGFLRIKRNVKINWLDLLKKTSDIKQVNSFWMTRYKKTKRPYDKHEMRLSSTVSQKEIKNWKDLYHVVIFAVSTEGIDITEPSVKSIFDSQYPNKNIIMVFAVEDYAEKTFEKEFEILYKKYGYQFADFKKYYHKKAKGEVIGKGPNISCAGKAFWKEYKNKGIKPEDILITTLDADHIVSPHYLSRLSYAYVIDPNRHNKTYQPIPLLFNNIWDAPPTNRIAAVSTSFWQIIEGMRPYRLRTFAAHAQSLDTLLKTDFWAVDSIVEDGHQYWRTYFTLGGDAHVYPLLIPVYQDAVLGVSLRDAIKAQYKQLKRWSYGVSDFPFVVINSFRHVEIPLHERLLQIYRQFSGFFTWASASFFLATSWIPLALNTNYQDLAFGHNATMYASQVLTYAWFGVFINYWLSLALMPKKPEGYGFRYNLEMVFQWALAPIYALFVLSIPALVTQTMLIFNKRMEVFWITPKIRKSTPKHR